jgi:hypothetical protein
VNVRTAARVAAALLVVTAVLFVIGVTQETGDQHAESTEATPDNRPDAGHGGESAEQREAEGHADVAEGAGEERQVFGVDPESPGLVSVAVVVSIAIAAGLWFTDKRALAAVAAVFAVLFAVLDVAEVSHQHDDGRDGLAALAIAVAVGHVVAALSSGSAALRPDPSLENT